MYINEIKKRKYLNEQTVEIISMIFFNTGYFGSTTGTKKEKNKYENNRLNLLLNLFEYLVSQTLERDY
jgi:hypothetical protein